MEAVWSNGMSSNFSRLHRRNSQKIENFICMKVYNNQYAHVYVLPKYFDGFKIMACDLNSLVKHIYVFDVWMGKYTTKLEYTLI
jgi:hypothetical protein